MTKASRPTKAELLAMLAEAVRNTQPQPADTQRDAVADVQPDPKRNKPARIKPARNIRPAPKRAAKTKGVRASGGRKRKR